jgi:hypothetical protein
MAITLSGISDLDFCLAHHMLLLPLDNNEFASRAGPNEFSGVSSAGFSPSDKPRLLLCNHFLRYCSDSPSSAQEFATAIAVLPARDRQRRDSPEHMASTQHYFEVSQDQADASEQAALLSVRM